MEKWNSEYAAVVGIDWGDQKHDVCLWVPGAEGAERSIIEHRPAKIAEWAGALRTRFGGKPVAVCLELSQGPIVSALLEHEFIVVVPIPPITLARYRRAFTPSRAKDDPTDAELAAELFVLHPERFKPLKRESGPMRSLRQLVKVRRELVEDRVRLTNRLICALKEHFPLVLSWFREKDTAVFLGFVERWPTLSAAKRARRETLESFFRSNNVRRVEVIERRIAAIKSERALTTDKATIETNRTVAALLLAQLRVLVENIRELDVQIEKLCGQQRDYALFATLPGAGPVLSSRLLVAFGEQRDRFPDTASLQKYAGIAPVTERSGKQHWVHWRWACPKFLRQTFVEWAGQTIPRSYWAKAFYAQQKAKGSSHNAAVRALAFKWIRILWRCWVDRTPYDEARYLEALRKRRSPLLKFAAEMSD